MLLRTIQIFLCALTLLAGRAQAAVFITPELATGTWVNTSSAVFRMDFPPGVDHYHMAWDQLSANVMMDSHTSYANSPATFTATADAANWHLHALDHDAPHVAGGPQINFGPFFIDRTLPTGFSFFHYSATGSLLAESQFGSLADAVTAQITVQDALAGTNLSGPAPVAVDSGTLSLWRFNEGSGSVFSDAGPLNLTLAVALGSIGHFPGRFASGLHFDGATYLLNGAPSGLPTGAGQRSVQAWIYPRSAAGVMGILSWGPSGNDPFRFSLNNGQLSVDMGGGYVSNGPVLSTGTWHHVAFSYDGATGRYYVNGQSVGSNAFGAVNTGPAPLYVGQTDLSERFIGTIDEVRISTIAISAGDMLADYQRGDPFFISYSTNTGNSWSVVTSTVPGTPGGWVSLSGAHGSTAAQTLTVLGLGLRTSTGTQTGSNGTNQIRFHYSDRAANYTTSGPFTVLVDSAIAVAVSTPVLPGNGAYAKAQTPFFWAGPSTVTAAGLFGSYFLEVSNSDPLFSPGSIAISVSTPIAQGSPGLDRVGGRYVSTFTLTGSTTYYWRVRARSPLGAFGPWSAASSFVVDAASPAAANFAVFSSTGGAFGETSNIDLVRGVTAQITVSDALSGLAHSGELAGGAGTIALLHFSEIHGSQPANEAPGGVPGVLATGGVGSSSPTYSAGHLGSGLECQSSQFHLARFSPGPFNFPAASDFSIEAWIRPNSVAGVRTIAAQGSPFGAGANYVFTLNSGRLQFVNNTGGGVLSSEPIVVDDAWQHVALVVAGVNTRFYYNGVLVDSADSGTGGNSGGGTMDFTVCGGLGTAGTSDSHFSGTIDEVRVSNFAASHEQIAAGYEATRRGRVSVEISSNAGNSYSVISATHSTPGRAHLAISGTEGSVGAQTLTVRDLILAHSTSSIVGPGATNFLRFRQNDLAGNSVLAGPFTVLADTAAATLVSTPSLPSSVVFVNAQPDFSWRGPSTTSLVNLLAPGNTLLQVASDASFGSIVVSVATPTVVEASGAPSTQGVYDSTFTLAHGLTYHWRTRSRDFLGLFSPALTVFNFTTDLDSPTLSNFAALSSTGGWIPESTALDSTASVSVRMTAADAGPAGISTNTLGGIRMFGVIYTTQGAAALPTWIDGAWADSYFSAAQNEATALEVFNATLFAGTGPNAEVLAYTHPTGWTVSGDLPGSTVEDFEPFQGQLYALSAGSGEIWRFNGAVWSSFFNSGETGGGALAAYGGRLYAGMRGQGRIYAYDAAAGVWFLSFDSPDTDVLSMAVHNGRLYAGTDQGVFVLDSGGWTRTLNLGAAVNDLKSYSGRLFAATSNSGRIYVFDGAWSVHFSPSESEATSLAVHDGRLYAGLGVPSNGRVYSYDNHSGDAWMLMRTLDNASSRVRAMVQYDKRLYTAALSAPASAAVYVSSPVAAAITGAEGSFGPETMMATGLNLGISANPNACGGIAVCSANNQVRFTVSDRAGGVKASGSFAVLTDPLMRPPTMQAPVDFAFARVNNPAFSVEASTPQPQHNLQVSRFANFGFLDVNFTAAGESLFPSPVLANNTTYYWRMRAQNAVGIYSAFSAARVVITDFTSPALSAYRHANSSGGILGETQYNNLFAGVTAQMTVQDTGGGLPLLAAGEGGPIGYWPFQDNAGTLVSDVSGNGRHGFATGAGQWTPAIRGVGFNAAAVHAVQISTPAGVTWNGMTVSAWARPSAAGDFMTLWATPEIQFHTRAAGTRMYYTMRTTGAGGCSPVTGPFIAANQWTHVAFVADAGANQNRIYLDGELAATCVGAATPSSRPLRFGADGLTGLGGSDNFNGEFDEFRLYDHAVTQAELRAEVRSSRWWTAFSTNSALSWNYVGSTVPAGGAFLSTLGGFGSTSPETLKVQNLTLRESTNTAVCAGSACGATNQVRFIASDRAGNFLDGGAFSVRVDTSVPLPIISSLTPLSTSSIFATASATDPLSGILDYRFEASSSAGFNFPVSDSGFIGSNQYTFLNLAGQTTYFTRVTVRDQLLNVSTPSVSVSTQTFGEVFYTTAAVAPAGALQNGVVGMLRFHLNAANGTAQFASLRAARTGTSSDADVTQARVYRDNGDGSFNAGDDILLAGAPFAAGSSQMNFGSLQPVDVNVSTYFVAYQMAPGAQVGQTVGLTISLSAHVGLIAPAFAIGSFPTTVPPIPITEGANNLSVAAVDLAPAAVVPNSVNVPMLRLNMNTDTGTSQLQNMVVRLAGTLPFNEISAVNLWRDADADGLFTVADDKLTSGADVFTAGVSTLNFTAPVSSRTVGTANERFFLTLDVAPAATQNRTFSVWIATPSELRLSNPPDTVSFAAVPVQSGTSTVIVNNTLSVSPLSAAPAVFTQGDRFAVLRATLTADAGLVDIDRVSVNRIGGGVDADLSAVEVWRDQVANGGPFNPLVDTLLGSSVLSGAHSDVDITTETVTAGATTVIFIVYRVHPGANPGNQLGASMANSAFVRVLSAATAVQGPFPFSSSTGTIQATVNEMRLPAHQSVAPGTMDQGAQNVAMIRLSAVSSRNNFSWLGLTLERLGTTADSDVTAVKIFRDDGASAGVYDSSDTLITSGADTFSSGQAAVAMTQIQTVSASTQTYFVTLSVAPGAAPGATLGVRVSTTAAFNVSAPNLVSTQTVSPPLFPITAGPVPVSQFANTVFVATAAIVPSGGVEPGTKDVGMMALEIRTDVSNASLQGLIVEEVGTAADSEVDAVKVYYDVNQLGYFDSTNLGQYQLVSSTVQSFGDAVPNFVTLNFATAPVLSPTAKRFFVTVDLATSAAPGGTVIVRAIDNTSFLVNAPNFMAPAGYTSPALTVNAPPSQLFVVGLDSAPAQLTQGGVNAVMAVLHLRMGAYTGSWTRLSVTRSGTGSDSDVALVKLYADSNANGLLDPVTDVRLSTAVFSAGTADLSFAPQLQTASTRTYFLAYDIAATAAAGGTVGARAAAPGAFIVSSPNSVNGAGFPIQSADSLIRATQASLFVSALDQAPGQLIQSAVNQVMMRLTLNTTEHAVLWSALTVRSTGTAADADISAVSVWRDVNANSVLEPGTDERISSAGTVFLNGRALIGLSSPQTVGTSARRYLIAVDMAAAANPSAAFGLLLESTAAFTLNTPNTVLPAGFPASSFIVGIDKLPESLVVTGTNIAPSGGMAQGFETAMARLDARASRSGVVWSQLRVNKAGNLSDSDVAAMRLYRDSDGSGTLTPGDFFVASAPFVTGQAALAFSSAQTVGVATQTYLVSAVLNLAAAVGANLGLTIPNAGFFTVAAPDSAASTGLPFATPLVPILDSRTPTIPVVTVEGPASADFEAVRFSWTSSVASGSIVGAEYAIGTTPGGTEVRAFTPLAASETTVAATGFPIASGTTYYVLVRAESNSGFKSPAGVSAASLKDFTVPPSPAPSATAGGSTILVTWGSVAGGPSGLRGYLVEYRSGSSPQWKNAKTGGASPAAAATLAEAKTQAVSASEVVTGNSFQAGGIPSGTVFVRMRAVSGAGTPSLPSSEVKVQLGALPDDGIANASSYPNPFDSRKEQASIHYALSAASDVSIKIYSVFGRSVKDMHFSAGSNGGLAGSNTVRWEGTDDSGRKVSKGMYLAVIEAGGAKVTLKIGVIH